MREFTSFVQTNQMWFWVPYPDAFSDQKRGHAVVFVPRLIRYSPYNNISPPEQPIKS